MQFLDGVLLESRGFYHDISRFFLFGLFVLENCFVQLLFTQHWAFMSSVQTKEEAAFWFAPIAGIGSIASTAAACTVSPLIDHFGLAALLSLSGVSMGCSAFLAADSYRLAEQHGFEPKPKENEKKIIAKNDGKNLLQRAVALFTRVPILGALCLEVIFSQCQSSLLNSLFVLKLKDAIPADGERARFTGNVSFPCDFLCSMLSLLGN
jgi:ATP/ADP translocase